MQGIHPALTVEDKMKLSIEAELVYNFANDTQIIANLEASRTNDQIILSESLDIQPTAQALSDTTPYGDRRIPPISNAKWSPRQFGFPKPHRRWRPEPPFLVRGRS
jgi:hypothetical protein